MNDDQTPHQRIRVLTEAFYHHKKTSNHRLDMIEKLLITLNKEVKIFRDHLNKEKENNHD